jgi:beta-ureidopropionase
LSDIIRVPANNQEVIVMPRVVRGGLIQATLCESAAAPVAKIKQAMLDKHLALIARAAAQGAQVVCLQELFYGPYFCAEQQSKWYELTERIPEGPTTRLMCEVAKKHGMVLVVPLYEEDLPGLYYNAAAVIDADGSYLGKYRKMHLPHCDPGFWEKFYFRPGNLGYPVFQTRVGKVGVYICYDRHFPEGARCLGLNGAEIVFNPSATVAGSRSICGSWNSRRTRWPTSISSGPSIGQVSRSPGESASFMDRATSATHAASSWRWANAAKTTS